MQTSWCLLWRSKLLYSRTPNPKPSTHTRRLCSPSNSRLHVNYMNSCAPVHHMISHAPQMNYHAHHPPCTDPHEFMSPCMSCVSCEDDNRTTESTRWTRCDGDVHGTNKSSKSELCLRNDFLYPGNPRALVHQKAFPRLYMHLT